MHPSNPVQRQIKAHKKSRGGCGNCKLRSVKCDETKPECKRCKAYGVICSYDKRKDASLQFSDEVASIQILNEIPFWPSRDEHLLSRFQLMVALTISCGDRLSVYQNDLIPLARQNDWLYHALLSLTLAHDRVMFSRPQPQVTADEANHFYRATSLFKKQFSKPLQRNQQFAMWTTAAFLFTLVFCHIDATGPEQCWPMAPPSSADLNWLAINEGKKQVKILSAELETDPVFARLSKTLPQMSRALNLPPSLDMFGEGFKEYYGFHDGTTPDNNPYYHFALGLSKLLSIGTPTVPTILSFLHHITEAHPKLRPLLERKDPRMLLLLGWWFSAIALCGVWWCTQRAILEGQAIFLFLETYFSDDETLQMLSQNPKAILAPLLVAGSVIKREENVNKLRFDQMTFRELVEASK